MALADGFSLVTWAAAQVCAIRPADGPISAVRHGKILGIGVSDDIGIAGAIDGDAADVVA